MSIFNKAYLRKSALSLSPVRVRTSTKYKGFHVGSAHAQGFYRGTVEIIGGFGVSEGSSSSFRF